MPKAHPVEVPPTRNYSPSRSNRRNGRLLGAVAVAVGALCSGALLFWSTRGSAHGLVSHTTQVIPSTIEPPHSTGIAWTSCGGHLECGRLEVPLDYANSSLGTASLAVARYVAPNRAIRLGSLFVNPGGPGGSGVELVKATGRIFSAYMEDKYDIVSWDPRGVEGTTPRVDCFTSKTAQDIFHANTHAEILPEARNLSNPADLAVFTSQLRLGDARTAAVAQLCHEQSGETIKHVGTTTVARDLERLHSTLEGDEAPINYWGFSYGSILGSYLVNMFPNRVGRIAIDGVVDPYLWANVFINKWIKNRLDDREKALQNFYNACAEAGPDRCALSSNTSTAKSISARVDKLIGDLYTHPLPVPHANRPGALTSSMIRTIIFTFLYRPRDWPRLASYLLSAMHGDGGPIMDEFLPSIELNVTVPAPTFYSTHAIICIDQPSYDGISNDAALQDLIDDIVAAEMTISPHFSALEMSTLNNEILVIGNTADPITPVVNAKAVNTRMPNSSRLVIQDGSGHCSIALASLCTAKTIKAYFLEGKLPLNGLVCPIDEPLFPPASSNSSDSGNWLNVSSAEDVQLLETIREFGNKMVPYLSGHGRIRIL